MILGAVVAQLLRFGGLGASSTGRIDLSYLAVTLAAAPAWILTMGFGGAMLHA